MSIRMALAKLSACAVGGAVVGGGAVHYAEQPAGPRVIHKKGPVRKARPAPRRVAQTVSTTTCTPGVVTVASAPVVDPGQGYAGPVGGAVIPAVAYGGGGFPGGGFFGGGGGFWGGGSSGGWVISSTSSSSSSTSSSTSTSTSGGPDKPPPYNPPPDNPPPYNPPPDNPPHDVPAPPMLILFGAAAAAMIARSALARKPAVVE